MLRALLIIGAGGAIGSAGRYLLQYVASRHFTIVFPVGTLVVNVLGCLLIGLIYGTADRAAWMSVEWRLFLATGICGGFTTFSTFSYESISLLREGSYGYAFLYVAGSIVVGFGATLAGIALAHTTCRVWLH